MRGKISILMPTYNDGSSIYKSIKSVIDQEYKNWELIIIDDGSIDNTREIVNRLMQEETRIKYIYQENRDQLNAILNGSKYIHGEYVTIFHSDDLLVDEKYYNKCIEFMEENKSYDGLIGDLIQIDEEDNFTKIIHVPEYKISSNNVAKSLIILGGNLFVDCFFIKTDIFKKYILEYYVKWNMPFWMHYLEGEPKQLNIKKVSFPILKYRVFSENYINSEIGKLNVVNGNLRTVATIMKYYSIPMFKVQFAIYRVFNKLNFKGKFKPLVIRGECKNKNVIIEYTLKYRFGSNFNDYKYLSAIKDFYDNFNNNTHIEFNEVINEEDVYMGKDIRIFNKKMLNENLPYVYNFIMEKMHKGFKRVLVINYEEKMKMEIVLKFFNIAPFVEVDIK